MNSLEYLRHIEKAQDRDSLAKQTAVYLAKKHKNFCVIKHEAAPDPYSVLADYEFLKNYESWREDFFNFTFPVHAGEVISFKEKFYVFLESDYNSGTGYFLISSEQPDKVVIEILNSWQALDKQLKNTNSSIQAAYSLENANIVSQLLHDIEAIIQLIPKSGLPSELEDRLTYQQKLNAKLLFYLRPLELLKEKLPVRELIKSSIQFKNLNPDSFPLTISPKVSDIDVDAELFARGFNEILSNALYACNDDPLKIRINIDIFQRASPLLNFNWLRITIYNEGPAIAEDFLQRVKEPFFTTHKYEGFTGFGLSIAGKIFEAHNGALEIKSSQGSGVTITIYLPLKNE